MNKLIINNKIRLLYKTIQTYLYYATPQTLNLSEEVFNELLITYSNEPTKYKTYSILFCLKDIICKDIHLIPKLKILSKTKMINTKLDTMLHQLQTTLISITSQKEIDDINKVLEILITTFDKNNNILNVLLSSVTNHKPFEIKQLPTSIEETFEKHDEITNKNNENNETSDDIILDILRQIFESD